MRLCIKFAPRFQTAGFGVFAGRVFEEGEVVLQSCMTMFLPINFPRSQAPWHYAFGYNKTHIALDLDYGSIFNHQENANARALRHEGIADEQRKLYQVRQVFKVQIAQL